MVDWKQEIAVACVVRSAIHEADTKGIWEYHLPNVSASANDIVLCEKRLGFHLDRGHKDFFSCANGWRRFYQSVDLFGTDDLCDPEWHSYFKDVFDALDESVLLGIGASISDFYAVAATRADLDVFLVGKPGTKLAGSVLWLAGTLVEKFPSFEEYFLSMVDYNRMEYNRLRSASG